MELTAVSIVGGMPVCLLLILAFAVTNGASNNICPKYFTPIGRKCYHFSSDEATWQDAHYKCLNINSTLAVVTKSQQEYLIRHHLNRNADKYGRLPRWIGGRFDWQQGRWIWGASGKALSFHAFSRMNPNLKEKWKWSCIIIDPDRQNKWSARSCLMKQRYVCQTNTNKYLVLKEKFKHNFTSSCSNLSSYEQKICLKFLNGSKKHPNDPAPIIQKKTDVEKDFICPSRMILVGRKCYFFSTDRLSWNEAYWSCRDNKSKLAVINSKQQNDILKGFLNGNFIEKQERWIGGIYDWKQNKWKWAINGETIKYRNFAKISENTDWNAITLDPQFQHKWSTRNQSEQKHYICQSKAKTVIKYGRIDQTNFV